MTDYKNMKRTDDSPPILHQVMGAILGFIFILSVCSIAWYVADITPVVGVSYVK